MAISTVTSRNAEAYCQHTDIPRNAADERSSHFKTIIALQAAFLQELKGVLVPLAPLKTAGEGINSDENLSPRLSPQLCDNLNPPDDGGITAGS
jgi:hypothetical protein